MGSALTNQPVLSSLFPMAVSPGKKAGQRAAPTRGRGGRAAAGKGKGTGRKKAPKKKPPRRWWRSILKWTATFMVWGFIGVLAVVAWFAHDLPPVADLVDSTRRPSLTVQAADGTVLASYGDMYGDVVPVEEMPPWMPGAVIAIEDRRFYSHFGVDPLGIARAMYINLQAGRMVQGGSTLTQQVVKNVFLTPERSLKRKVQEALLALWMDYKFTKEQILTLYLNRVYLGAGTFGVEAAAQRYFGVSVRQVTPFQAAVLAGLLKAPSRYSPANNPDLAVGRASVVLQAMVETGVIGETDAQQALAGGTELVKRAQAPRPGRHFSDWVMEQVDDYIGQVNADVIVKTTLDPALQRSAERALSSALAANGGALKAGEGAVVVLSTDGAVRAMVGGRDYGASQFNRAVQALRQPGSAFKPFVYLAGLEAGLHPSDTVDDSPVTVDGWSPDNFDHRYRGPMKLSDAVAQSINTVAVRVSEMAGRDEVIAVARRLGMTTDFEPTPSLALGAQETAVLPLVAAYAPFANGGTGVSAYGVTAIVTRDGQVLYDRQGSGMGTVIAPKHVGAMNALLSGVVTSGTGRRAALDRPAGGKTGTSANYRDAWFVGYTADYVAGVWLGNDDGSPMNKVTGGSLPAEIWKVVMEDAHRGLPPRPLPGPKPDDDPMGSFIRSIFGSSDPAPPAPAAPAPAEQPSEGLVPAGPKTPQEVLDLFDRN